MEWQQHPIFKWLVGQVVKTPPFHGGNMSPNLIRVTREVRESMKLVSYATALMEKQICNNI